MTKGKTTMHILDVAKWNATDNEILACKFVTTSHEDRFTTKSRLIVSTGQEAVVVLNGNMTGPFKPCPEGHAMNTKNLPLLTDLWAKLMYSGETPYPAEIWFVQVASAPDFGWGTQTPVMFGTTYDSNGIHLDLTAGVTMYGMMELAITDTMKFMSKMVQTKPMFTRTDLREALNARLMQILKPALARMVREGTVSVRDVTMCQDQVGKSVFEAFKGEVAAYGLELVSFSVEDIRLTPETAAQIRDLDTKAAEVAKEALERSQLDLSRKEERQFDVADLAASNKGAGSIITPLVGAAVGMGVAGGIAGTVLGAMPSASSAGMVPPPLPGASAVPPLSPPQVERQYRVAIDGKQYGPYLVTRLAQWMREGKIAFTPETLVWRQGMPTWVRYGDCAELADAIAQINGNLEDCPPPPLPRV